MNYLDAQFMRYSPCTLASLESIKVKIHSERADTNWLNIDAQAAREIETAIEGAYSRAQDRDHSGQTSTGQIGKVKLFF